MQHALFKRRTQFWGKFVRSGTCGCTVQASDTPLGHADSCDAGAAVVDPNISRSDKTVTDNTLFGSAGKDKIDGKTGNDLIDGKGGNDQIDGGSGDDMIGGGAGSDNIKGGDGNDYISSSAGIQNTRQQVSATDTWNRWGLPDGETAIQQGAMWGTYLSQQTPEFKVTVWSGITDTSTDVTDTEGDVIDGGAGNDWVMGSWATDRIKSGDGQDRRVNQ